MMTQGRGPVPDLKRLTPIAMDDIVMGFVASQKAGRCDKILALAALSAILPAETALAHMVQRGVIEEREGRLFADAERPNASAEKYRDFSGGWTAVRHRLALRAVSSATQKNVDFAQADLAAAALRHIYGLDDIGPFPSRAQVRCALLLRAVAMAGKPFDALTARPQKPFKFDALSRSLYLTWAGLKTGTVGQADAALLRAAFQFKGMAELPSAILRAAVVMNASAPAHATPAQVAPAAAKAPLIQLTPACAEDDLEAFAKSIRKLAGKLETKPYAGRVAIAQVYDAGIAQGLGLGSLDDFKRQVAEAAREGLLDLERYDIAGPLDAALRERSRLRLGRDERHFIVNQWI